jgi:excisionase family DNA binding protein
MSTTPPERYLTVPEAAAVFNTGERFVRRLVAERRITVVHVGRHVRIPESAVLAFIQAGTVPAFDAPRVDRHLKAVA